MAPDAEKITELLRYAPSACMIVEHGVVRGANAEAIQVTGIPRARLVGAPLVDLIVDDQQVNLSQALDTTVVSVAYVPVRLAAGLTPLELSLRRVDETTFMVGVRRMDLEHRLSAMAGGELTHDQVTGLPDRYHVLEQLHERLTISPAQPLAIVAIWIDDLSTLEEERGARVVERVCRQVGDRIQARLRGPDLLGRIDRSAFLALLNSDSDLEQLKVIADRLRSEVAFPVEFDGGLVSFTASVMLGSVGSKRPTVERVLTRIETAGRKAAASGGNRTDVVTL